MSFDVSTLDSMCESITDCPHSTPEWTESGRVVIRNQNIKNGVLDLSSPSFTNEEDYQHRIKRAKPQAGDIVFTREAPMGEVCLIPEDLDCCLGQRQVLLRPKKDVNGRYLFWALQSPFVQQQIAWNEGTGSTVSNVRIPVLKALNIPRNSDEDSIANVLSSLADKIELNRQTNQTLEQIAQALFKSWFVDFEPTRAKIAAKEADASPEEIERAAMCAISGKTPDQLAQLPPETQQSLKTTAALFPDALVDSELGEVPEGWDVKSLSAIIEIIGGGTPKRSEESYWNGDIPWFSVRDVPASSDIFVVDTEEKISEIGLQKSSTKLLPIGTTIISARGTVGKLALVSTPMCMNQSCYGIRGKDGFGSFFNYFNLREAVDTLLRNVHGAVFDTITTQTFESYSMAVSTEGLTKQFDVSVEPLLKRIELNVRENITLSKIRDSLLPKLLSGEIEPRRYEPRSVSYNRRSNNGYARLTH